MDVRTDDGCRLWTEAVGDGVPLLLCHGGPGLWDQFGDLADVLAGDCRSIRWDQRGGGRSEHRGPYSVARSVADLDAVRQAYGLEAVAVLGHSWGATLALRYALAHPGRVSELVYVAGTGLGRAWKAEYQANRAARIGAGRERWEQLRGAARTPPEDREFAVLEWSADFARDGLARAGRVATPWFGINWEANAAIGAELREGPGEDELAAACRGLGVPVLLVDGELDIRPRWAVDSLEAALPDVRRVRLPGAGHLPWAEDPRGFRDAVAGHLTR